MKPFSDMISQIAQLTNAAGDSSLTFTTIKMSLEQETKQRSLFTSHRLRTQEVLQSPWSSPEGLQSLTYCPSGEGLEISAGCRTGGPNQEWTIERQTERTSWQQLISQQWQWHVDKRRRREITEKVQHSGVWWGNINSYIIDLWSSSAGSLLWDEAQLRSETGHWSQELPASLTPDQWLNCGSPEACFCSSVLKFWKCFPLSETKMKTWRREKRKKVSYQDVRHVVRRAGG